MGQFCYCSLSPQGDDNSFAIVRLLRSRIAAYPRKGTITQDEQSNQEHFDCSLSPQGDDNIIIVIYMQSPFIAAYPRKGTITC